MRMSSEQVFSRPSGLWWLVCKSCQSGPQMNRVRTSLHDLCLQRHVFFPQSNNQVEMGNMHALDLTYCVSVHHVFTSIECRPVPCKRPSCLSMFAGTSLDGAPSFSSKLMTTLPTAHDRKHFGNLTGTCHDMLLNPKTRNIPQTCLLRGILHAHA
jgi:hypothetical protein